MHGQQNDKYTEMHGQQNDKYTEMHGKQNKKYSVLIEWRIGREKTRETKQKASYGRWPLAPNAFSTKSLPYYI
jgi:hypothetical protein